MKLTRRHMLGLLAVSLGSTGCYGKFGLTKRVYDWNGGLGNKWLVEIVFLVLAILPVYGICIFVDAILFNLIEFWTGSNPMAQNTVMPDGTQIAITPVDGAPNTACVTVRRPGGETHVVFATRSAERGIVLRDAAGNVITRVTPKGRDVELLVAASARSEETVRLIAKKRLETVQRDIAAGATPSAAVGRELGAELPLREV